MLQIKLKFIANTFFTSFVLMILNNPLILKDRLAVFYLVFKIFTDPGLY